MKPSLALFLLAILAAEASSPEKIARPLPGSGRHRRPRSMACESWRLAVETNNVRGWRTVPRRCGRYVGRYMLGEGYRQDSGVVVAEAEQYARRLQLGGDGREVWVFDVDDTALSNLPYYARRGFGVRRHNETALSSWMVRSTRAALPESLRLYRSLLSLGIKVIFISSGIEDTRAFVETNLRNAGYLTWEKLILKEAGMRITNIAFKTKERRKLVQQGYKIVGNMGDQWSDILGSPEGDRTFKLPNPMYYLS